MNFSIYIKLNQNTMLCQTMPFYHASVNFASEIKSKKISIGDRLLKHCGHKCRLVSF